MIGFCKEIRISPLFLSLVLVVSYANTIFASEGPSDLILSSSDFVSSCYLSLMQDGSKIILPKDSELEQQFYEISSSATENNERQVRTDLMKLLKEKMLSRNLDAGLVDSSVGAEIFGQYQQIFKLYVSAQLQASEFKSPEQLYSFYRSYLYVGSEEKRRDFADSVILRMVLTFPLDIQMSSPEDLEHTQAYMEAFQVSDIAFGKFIYFWNMMLQGNHLDILRAYVRVLIRAVATDALQTLERSMPPKTMVGSLLSWFPKKKVQNINLPDFLFYENLLDDKTIKVLEIKHQAEFYGKSTQHSGAWIAFEKTQGAPVVLQNLFLEYYYPYMKIDELGSLLEIESLPERLTRKIKSFLERLREYKELTKELDVAKSKIDSLKKQKGKEVRSHQTNLPHISYDLDRAIEQKVKSEYAANKGDLPSVINGVLRWIISSDTIEKQKVKFLVAGTYFRNDQHPGTDNTPPLREEVISLLREAKRLGITKKKMLSFWAGVLKVQVSHKGLPKTIKTTGVKNSSKDDVKYHKTDFYNYVDEVSEALEALPKFKSTLDDKIEDAEKDYSALNKKLNSFLEELKAEFGNE